MTQEIFNSKTGLSIIVQTAKEAYILCGQDGEDKVQSLIMLLEELESLNEITLEQLSLAKKEILDWKENESVELGEEYDKADLMSCIKWLKRNMDKSGKSELEEGVQYFVDYWQILYQTA